mgnify:CR=1 FL=1
MRAVSRLTRLRALEAQRRRREPEQALWLGWPGCWVGPSGEQRAEPPVGRVIVLRWGDEQPEGQPSGNIARTNTSNTA